MSPTFQTILALTIVAIAVGFIGHQLFSVAVGRRSKIGSCCAKGCDATTSTTGPRTQFIPSEALFKRR